MPLEVRWLARHGFVLQTAIDSFLDCYTEELQRASATATPTPADSHVLDAYGRLTGYQLGDKQP